MQAFFQEELFRLEGGYTPLMQRGRKPTKEAPPFGQRLSSLRKKRGLTQYEFAGELGISRNLVVHYERACENPTMDFVVRAVKILDASADELLGLAEEAKKKPGPPPRLARVAERIAKLPKAKQAMILDMVEGAIGQAS